MLLLAALSAYGADPVRGSELRTTLDGFLEQAPVGQILVGAAGFDARDLAQDQLGSSPGNYLIHRVPEGREDATAATDRRRRKEALDCAVVLRFRGTDASRAATVEQAGPWGGASLHDFLFPPDRVVADAPEPEAPPAPAASAPAAPAAGTLADPWSDLVEEVVALEGAAAREERLTEELVARAGQADAADPLASALAVSRALDATDRADPTVLRLFLVAALDSEASTRASAVDAAEAGGDPPLPARSERVARVPEPAPVPATPPPEPASPASLRTYRSQYLKRDRLDLVSVTTTPQWTLVGQVNTWTVVQGGSVPLIPYTFATLVGDRSKAAALRQSKSTHTAWVVGLAGVGTAMFVGGAGATLANLDSDATPGLVVMTVSLVPLTAMAFEAKALQRLKLFDHQYTVSEADRDIESYNSKLRDQLGLDEGATTEIDGTQ